MAEFENGVVVIEAGDNPEFTEMSCCISSFIVYLSN